MTSEFGICFDWLPSETGIDAFRGTSGRMVINVGEVNVTRSEDEWSRSIRDDVFVSAYPLAEWFASGWWRLCFEPASGKVAPNSWLMSHDMVSTGHGYIWPSIQFDSDGEFISVVWRGNRRSATEPIRYLETGQGSMPLAHFKREVTEFVMLVLRRLDAIGMSDTPLHSLWTELVSECESTELHDYRRLEALLGFDPDDAPESLVTAISEHGLSIGVSSALELAAACSGESPSDRFESIVELSESATDVANFPSFSDLSPVPRQERGWQIGMDLARKVRRSIGMDPASPVSDNDLTDLLGMSPGFINDYHSGLSRAVSNAPVSLAVRKDSSHRFGITLRKPHPHARRFEATRLFCDYLIAPQADTWLLATDVKTSRQKIQRAFTTEFLCPIDALIEYLHGDHSIDAQEEASDYFSVSSLLIHHHLENNGYVSEVAGP